MDLMSFSGLAARDVLHGFRVLRRDWRFVAAFVSIIALGVGANVAVFDCVDTLLFRPPAGVSDAARVYFVDEISGYAEFVRQSHRITTLDLASMTPATEVSLGSGAAAAPVKLQCVSDSFLPVLGVRPLIGRTFSGGSEWGPRPLEVILSHGIWRSQFGAEENVVGRVVNISNRSFEVIGVLPQGFIGIGAGIPDIWVHIASEPTLCSFSATNLLRSREAHWTSTVGRLHAGVSISTAAEEVIGGVDSGRGGIKNSRRGLTPVIGSRGRSESDRRRVALWLAAGSVVLLIIACTNVTCLTWIRMLGREEEIAVRRALGATFANLYLQAGIEAFLISAICIPTTMLVAFSLQTALSSFFPVLQDVGWARPQIWATLIFGATLSCAISSLVPLSLLLRLKSNLATSRRASATRSPGRKALVAAQVALSVVLLVAAGQFQRSLQSVYRAVGYDLDRVMVISPDLQRGGFYRVSQIEEVIERLQQAVSQIPQVESVATTSDRVLGAGPSSSFVTPIRTSPHGPAVTNPLPILTVVSREYFSTLGLAFTAGHSFDPNGTDRGSQTVIDSRTAETLWPGESAIGRCVYVLAATNCVRVVGVVRNRVEANGMAGNTFFLSSDDPTARQRFPPQVLVVRTRTAASAAAPAIARVARAQGDSMPYVTVKPLSVLASAQATSWRLGADTFGFFSIAAMVLATVALYAVLSLEVRQRSMEIGVRLALGATPRQVGAWLLGRGARLWAAGAILGTLLSLGSSSLLRGSLFAASAIDVRAVWMAVLALGLAALLGLLLPAVAAARTDPTNCLRRN